MFRVRCFTNLDPRVAGERGKHLGVPSKKPSKKHLLLENLLRRTLLRVAGCCMTLLVSTLSKIPKSEGDKKGRVPKSSLPGKTLQNKACGTHLWRDLSQVSALGKWGRAQMGSDGFNRISTTF